MKLLFLASSLPFTEADLQETLRFTHTLGVKAAGQVDWLKPSHGRQAVKATIHEELTLLQARQLREHLAMKKVDVLCLPDVCPYPRLLLADMDCTMITTETLDELAIIAGKGDEVQAITRQTMNGSLPFAEALVQRVAMLKGMPEVDVLAVIHDTRLSDGAERFVKTLRAHGTRCVLVSGGFTSFTTIFHARCGFHAHHANMLDIKDGVVAGTVTPPILDREAKLTYLEQYAQELAIPFSRAMTIGDGANDLLMLKAVGLGIGYRPKPFVEEMLLNVLKYAPMDDLLLMFDTVA